MSAGIGMITALIREKRPFSDIRDAGITDAFLVKQERPIFKFVEEHYLRYSKLPKKSTIEKHLRAALPVINDEPFGYWIDAVFRRHETKIINRALKEVSSTTATGGDLKDAKGIIRRLVLDLEESSREKTVTTLEGLAPEVLAHHDTRQKAGTMLGVPFGVQFLDTISDGAQPGDLVALVGRPGVGKSYLLFNMASYAHLHHDSTPMVATIEMPPLQCARRIIALRTGVSSTLMRLGRMSHWGREKVAQGIVALTSDEAKNPFYIIRGSFSSTIEDLVLRIRELRPSVVYVDGAYLLRTRNKNLARWERVTEATEYLKAIALDFNIPVIASYQFNRKGSGSLTNIGYSDAIGQLASIVIDIDHVEEQSETTWSSKQFRLLKLLKGREGETGTIRITYDLEHMLIQQDEVLGEGDTIPMDGDGNDNPFD